MTAVACVVVNRCHAAQQYVIAHGRPHPEFGDGTIADCCLRPEQFDTWNDDDPNLEVIKAVTLDDPVFKEAWDIATQAVNGELADVTNGALFYYAKSMPEPPYWAKGKTPCADIGNQLYFNNIS
jgi:N-acetylmuramoyl-L-alanine amidase